MSRPRHEIVFIYKVEGKNCPVTIDGAETRVDVSAVIHHAERDSPELREELAHTIASAIGAEGLTASSLRVSMGGFVPRQFADKDSIVSFPTLSGLKARVCLAFDIGPLSGAEMDPLFEFETALDEHLTSTGAGIVDGNEVGMGEYCIYCFGKKKQDLLASVEAFAKARAPRSYRIE